MGCTCFTSEKKPSVVIGLREEIDNQRYGGVSVDDETFRITSFGDHAQSASVLTNGGVYWLNTPLLKESSFANFIKPASFEKELIPELINNGKELYGLVSRDKFIDIGVPQDYDLAQKLLPKWESLWTN